MSRLVIVSNRVADLDNPNQAGGLAVAVKEALHERGGIWFGWDGETVPSGTQVPPKIESSGSTTVITLPMTRRDYQEYYTGFSNRVLWPLLHYRLDLIDYKKSFLSGYRRVNSKFADALSPHLMDSDTIWVHDFHLIPLGSELRKRGHNHRIGFFLHIPFPPPDILAAAPEHSLLIEALFAYDLVGFQTQTDLSNFHRYIEQDCGGAISEGGEVTAFGKSAKTGAFPISIDVEAFNKMSQSPDALEKIRTQAMRQRSLNRQTIIGVDRLDYSKGLPDRFRAFERLLDLHPNYIKRVTFMQIAPPTREDVEAYSDIRTELEMLSGAINGRYADFDWVPLRYIHRAVARETLAALFRVSQVGLVSPLRDGMNLVAKEYVAAQDENDPGVLVLSKFAGAAEELEEALIINPYDVDEMAESLKRALSMTKVERCDRHRALFRRIRQNDISRWHSHFVQVLSSTPRRAV